MENTAWKVKREAPAAEKWVFKRSNEINTAVTSGQCFHFPAPSAGIKWGRIKRLLLKPSLSRPSRNNLKNRQKSSPVEHCHHVNVTRNKSNQCELLFLPLKRKDQLQVSRTICETFAEVFCFSITVYHSENTVLTAPKILNSPHMSPVAWFFYKQWLCEWKKKSDSAEVLHC